MQSNLIFESIAMQEKVFIAFPARSGTALAAPLPLILALLSEIGKTTQ